MVASEVNMKTLLPAILGILVMVVLVYGLTDEEYNECKNDLSQSFSTETSLDRFSRNCFKEAREKCSFSIDETQEFCDRLRADPTTAGPTLELERIRYGNLLSGKAHILKNEDVCKQLAERLSRPIIERYKKQNPGSECTVESNVKEHKVGEILSSDLIVYVCEWSVTCKDTEGNEAALLSHEGIPDSEKGGVILGSKE